MTASVVRETEMTVETDINRDDGVSEVARRRTRRTNAPCTNTASQVDVYSVAVYKPVHVHRAYVRAAAQIRLGTLAVAQGAYACAWGEARPMTRNRESVWHGQTRPDSDRGGGKSELDALLILLSESIRVTETRSSSF
jgi:hypothetical protein